MSSPNIMTGTPTNNITTTNNTGADIAIGANSSSTNNTSISQRRPDPPALVPRAHFENPSDNGSNNNSSSDDDEDSDNDDGGKTSPVWPLEGQDGNNHDTNHGPGDGRNNVIVDVDEYALECEQHDQERHPPNKSHAAGVMEDAKQQVHPPEQEERIPIGHQNNDKNAMAEARQLAKQWDEQDRRMKKQQHNNKQQWAVHKKQPFPQEKIGPHQDAPPISHGAAPRGEGQQSQGQSQQSQGQSQQSQGVHPYLSGSILDYKINGVDYGEDPSAEEEGSDHFHPPRPPPLADEGNDAEAPNFAAASAQPARMTTTTARLPQPIPVAQSQSQQQQPEQFSDVVISAELVRVTGDSLVPDIKDTSNKQARSSLWQQLIPAGTGRQMVCFGVVALLVGLAAVGTACGSGNCGGSAAASPAVVTSNNPTTPALTDTPTVHPTFVTRAPANTDADPTSQPTASAPETTVSLLGKTISTTRTRIDFSSSGLQGSLPSEVGYLTSLTLLDFGSNQISETIPSEVGLLTQLTLLDLSSNQLSGTMPSQMGLLTQLSALLLDINQLSGTIPSQLGLLTQLLHLWIHTNQLSGTIPSDLGLLTQLSALSVANNQLSGEVPSTVCALDNVLVDVDADEVTCPENCATICG